MNVSTSKGARMVGPPVVICLLLGLIFTTSTAAVTKPKPWQWTTAQASAALMRQAEDFYVDTQTRDLTSAKCRGTGKRVGQRYVTFACTASLKVGLSEPASSVKVLARTRRAGGMCWAVAPAKVPSGCLVAGRRGVGSPRDAWVATYAVVDDRSVQDGHCLPNGAGFFTCSWTLADGAHRGTVVFSPSPVVRMLS